MTFKTGYKKDDKNACDFIIVSVTNLYHGTPAHTRQKNTPPPPNLVQKASTVATSSLTQLFDQVISSTLRKQSGIFYLK